MAKKHSTRDRLCEAAIRTASRDGLLAMTLDNVAREAHVSKGGVMYHFPTKEQLVFAMVEYFGERLERVLLERVALDPDPVNRWARAMIDFTFPAVPSPDGTTDASGTADPGMLKPEALDQFFLAMLAAAVTHPGILEPLRAVGKRIQERLLDEPHAGLNQMLVWLAMDGLFLWQFVGLIDRKDPLFQRIGEELRQRVASTRPPVTPSVGTAVRPRTGRSGPAAPGGEVRDRRTLRKEDLE